MVILTLLIYMTRYQNCILLFGHINNKISTKLHVKKDKKDQLGQKSRGIYTGIRDKPVFQDLVLFLCGCLWYKHTVKYIHADCRHKLSWSLMSPETQTTNLWTRLWHRQGQPYQITTLHVQMFLKSFIVNKMRTDGAKMLTSQKANTFLFLTALIVFVIKENWSQLCSRCCLIRIRLY